MKKALFLDRDGILNKVVIRNGIVSSPRLLTEFEIIGEAIKVVETAKTLGYMRIVVTNQPDIERKKMDVSELEKIHKTLNKTFLLDDILVCTSSDNSDFRRKPNPGMLFEAAEKFNINLGNSFFLGDSNKDIIAGKKAGVKTILLQTDYNVDVHGIADYNINALSEVNILFRREQMSFSSKYLEQAKQIAESIDASAIERMAQVLKKTRDEGGRLFLVGSGGGAGHASHATCDFRKLGGFEAYCPMDNVSELSARINDDGWDSSVANYLKGSKINSKDCIFVFSVGGGNEEKNISTNLVNAVKLAKEVGAKVIGVVGKDGGYTAKSSDACLIVPTIDASLITPHTESFQALVWHLLVSHPDLQLNPTKWESTK